MPRRCRYTSPPDRRLTPGSRFLPPPLLRSEVLRGLRERFILVQQLIAAFGLDFRVAYTPVDHPSVTIAMALFWGVRDWGALLLVSPCLFILTFGQPLVSPHCITGGCTSPP